MYKLWPRKIRTDAQCTHAQAMHKPHKTHAHTPNCSCTNYVSLRASWLDRNAMESKRQMDFKENPSFDHSIILSIDTCRRFFLILYNITGHMLFCCHSNQWLMLQMIIYSDTDVRANFRHKNILYRHSLSS